MKKPLLLLFLFLSACASKQVPSPESVEKPTPRPVYESLEEVENIDYDRLQSHLNMDRAFSNLGYTEKSFNTCEVGYGYSANKNCRRDYFVLIHFQLMCRDTHQESYTEALGANDMRPLKGRAVKWSLQRATGSVNLDDSGYGQIKTTMRASQKTQRLKINVGNDNLYIRAGEFNRIVTPPNWCY